MTAPAKPGPLNMGVYQNLITIINSLLFHSTWWSFLNMSILLCTRNCASSTASGLPVRVTVRSPSAVCSSSVDICT